MKLKLFYLSLTSLSITESTGPRFLILLVPETLNPAFAGTLITGYAGLIHRKTHKDTDNFLVTVWRTVNTH
jgi:hypothetical protein